MQHIRALDLPFGNPAASWRPLGFASPPRGGFAFVVDVLHHLYAPFRSKKYPVARADHRAGALPPRAASTGMPGGAKARTSSRGKDGGYESPFGNPAASSSERPVALRPRLAAGLPLSRTVGSIQKLAACSDLSNCGRMPL
jgi:hypothetical protein